MTWLKENSRFKEYIKFKESKENIIRKLSSLTDEQKRTAIDFFNKHQDWEKEIDWNKGQNLSWNDDFKPVIYKDRNTASQKYKKTKQELKKALNGLVEGKDYLYIADGNYEGSLWTLYQPLTYNGSKVIASNYVPPARTDLNDNGNPLSGAQWCTAWQSTDKYWIKHSIKNREAYLYLIGETIPTKKIALSISTIPNKKSDSDGIPFKYTAGDYGFNIWDFNDKPHTISLDELNKILDVQKYVLQAVDNYFKIEGYIDSSVRAEIVAEWGEDAVDAYETVMEETPESKEDFEDKYIGYYPDFHDFVWEIMSDDEIEGDRIDMFILAYNLGDDLMKSDLNRLSNKEFMDKYFGVGARLVNDNNEIIDYDGTDKDWEQYKVNTFTISRQDIADKWLAENYDDSYYTLKEILDESTLSRYVDWNFLKEYAEDQYLVFHNHWFFRS